MMSLPSISGRSLAFLRSLRSAMPLFEAVEARASPAA